MTLCYNYSILDFKYIWIYRSIGRHFKCSVDTIILNLLIAEWCLRPFLSSRSIGRNFKCYVDTLIWNLLAVKWYLRPFPSFRHLFRWSWRYQSVECRRRSGRLSLYPSPESLKESIQFKLCPENLQKFNLKIIIQWIFW